MRWPTRAARMNPWANFGTVGKYGEAYSCTEMASAAHVYGKRIVGAEAFTSSKGENWLAHPGNIKDLGDWAFCEGINRFVIHRYAMQPWPDVRPGMSMGPWGLHYERTQTWWEQSRPWHEYLARCQFLLQQGLFVADLCLLGPEGSPQSLNGQPSFTISSNRSRGKPRERSDYSYDTCPPEVVLTRMSVKDGRIVLPDGMSYRLLVLPRAETMTPQLLRKIRDLVKAGATVVGARPLKSPSLADYPRCDQQVKELADELWGTEPAPSGWTERRFGKGAILCSRELEKARTPDPEASQSFQCRKMDLAQRKPSGPGGSARHSLFPSARNPRSRRPHRIGATLHRGRQFLRVLGQRPARRFRRAICPSPGFRMSPPFFDRETISSPPAS